MKKFVVWLFIVTLSMAIIACQSEETGGGNLNQETEEVVETEEKAETVEVKEEAYYPITYTTYNYAKEPVEVTIEKEPESVVAIYQNSIETLLALV